ncbi:MAG: DUF3275 family protein [Burkholderiaceae bacterium]
MNAVRHAHLESIVVPGQLKLRTIRGRNGPFNVCLLTCCLGDFVVKDPEFEQYKEGKYEGEFAIRRIFNKPALSQGGVRIELRASLNGMTLSGIDKLGKEDARTFNVQEVDPIDEEQPAAVAATPAAVPASTTNDPLIDTRPFGMEAPAAPVAVGSPDAEDVALFGLLWPLGETVKLDPTIDRRTLRLQCTRLSKLGYSFDATLQQWQHEAELAAA